MRNQAQEAILNESICMKFKNRQTMVTEMRMLVTFRRRVALTGNRSMMMGLLGCCSTVRYGEQFWGCKH